jgi:hypothetical protein
VSPEPFDDAQENEDGRRQASRQPSRRRQKGNLRLFAIARSDITAALHAAEILQALHRQAGGDAYAPMRRTIFFPVLHALVISYSRPFVATRTSPHLQGRWARFDATRLQQAHEEVIAMRNDFVAHRDEDQRQVTVYPDGSYTPPGFPSANKGLGISTSSVVLGAPIIDAFAECCADVGRRLNSEVERLLQELYGARTDLPRQPFEVSDDDEL